MGGGSDGQSAAEGGGPGKSIWVDPRLYEELAYCVPKGIPHSKFLAWDEDDQDKALAWEREQRKVCDGCGTRKEQWERDKFAFVADTWRCPGCELIEMEKNNIPEGQEKGIKIHLVPRELAPEIQDLSPSRFPAPAPAIPEGML